MEARGRHERILWNQLGGAYAAPCADRTKQHCHGELGGEQGGARAEHPETLTRSTRAPGRTQAFTPNAR